MGLEHLPEHFPRGFCLLVPWAVCSPHAQSWGFPEIFPHINKDFNHFMVTEAKMEPISTHNILSVDKQ